MDWIVFRVAELYLNYAEALNEYYETPPKEAFDAVLKVRERSGMPGFPSTLNKEQFREKLRRERDDEGVMKGAMYGLQLSAVTGAPGKVHYKPYVFENRLWSDRSYLHPIKQTEIDKGYMLQNPGW